MQCYVCGNNQSSSRPLTNSGFEEISCPRCGKYQITYPAKASLGTMKAPSHILSSALRYASDRGKIYILDGTGNEEEIVKMFRIPSDPLEMVDRLLEGISKLPDGASFGVKHYDWNTARSFIATDNSQDVAAATTLGMELDFLEQQPMNSPGAVRILPGGWKRLRELNQQVGKGKNAFVALHFSGEMLNVYDNVYDPVLRSKGFEPSPTVHPVHNEKIDDFIISEISKSALLIADFTGHRQNVYFEAGLAMGLKTTVIWALKNGEPEPHFDTRQFNHIIWDNEDDLKKKLMARIDALPFRPA